MENNAIKAQTVSLVARLASKFGVEPGKLMASLMNQVFKQSDGVAPSNEELMVLLLVCENFGLNPFNREIFAFREKAEMSFLLSVWTDGAKSSGTKKTLTECPSNSRSQQSSSTATAESSLNTLNALSNSRVLKIPSPSKSTWLSVLTKNLLSGENGLDEC